MQSVLLADAAYILCSRLYVTVRCPSVRLSVYPMYQPLQQQAASLLVSILSLSSCVNNTVARVSVKSIRCFKKVFCQNVCALERLTADETSFRCNLSSCTLIMRLLLSIRKIGIVHIRNICEKFFTVSSVKKLFESVKVILLLLLS